MKGKIFNAQEVQAIIAGTKTMFREVIKPQPIQLEGFSDVYFDCYSKGNPWNCYTKGNKQPLGTIAKCPYQVGQKIFVKESFVDFRSNNSDIFYKSDFEINNLVKTADLKWRPAQHMKQEHSRLTLEITDVKVERLQDISVDDCWKEGMDYLPECCQNYIAIPDCNGNPTPSCCNNPNVVHPQPQFEQIWNATHKKPEEKFEVNPFVWVVNFKINK